MKAVRLANRSRPAGLRLFLLSVLSNSLLILFLGISAANAHEGPGKGTVDGEITEDSETKLTLQEREYLQSLSVIRVGLIEDQPPLTMVQSGEAVGYLNELLLKVTKELDVKVQFFPMTYTRSVDALINHELDMLNDYSGDKKLSQKILESQPVLESPFVAVGDSRLAPVHSMEDVRNKKLVMVRGFQQTTMVREHYPEYELMVVNDIDEAYRALRRNDADIYIDNATHAGFYLVEHMINDLRILGEVPQEELGVLSLRFAINNQHPLLHSSVNKVIEQFVKTKRLNKLKEKWLYSQLDSERFVLTEEEKAWLKENPEVRVVLDPGWAPVEYRDSAGKYEGISLDYLARIEAILDIDFRVMEGLDWQEGVEAVRSRRADMFASVAQTPQRDAYLKFTRPYIHMPIRIFARDEISYIGGLDNLQDNKIAVVENYAIHDWLSKDYPKLKLVPVETPVDGLARVADGKIDVFIGNVVTTNYYIKKHGFSSLNEVGDTPYSNSQAMAVRDDWPVFAGILQKALNAIPGAERKNIFNRWVSLRFERSVDSKVVWLVLLGALVIIAGFVYWNRSLDRQIARHTRDLAASEMRFRNLFEKNMSVMILVDPVSGKIVEANQSAEDYYGYPMSDLVGMPISNINTLPVDEINEQIKKSDK